VNDGGPFDPGAIARRSGFVGSVVRNRYRVLSFVGSGGMGSVYRVEHIALKKSFALKLLHADLGRDPRMVRRFEREALAAASIRSDFVVNIVDCDAIDESSPYFVMELLDGRSLRDVLVHETKLPVERAVNIGIDVCLGLAAVHAAGLVHRDVKPDNLFLTRSGDGRELAKLLDFGIVKLLDSDSTRPDALLGTLRYMAPEQIRSSAQVGPLADIFSLGATLYECLTGGPPFKAETLEQVLFRIMNEDPEPLDRAAPDVPKALGAVIHRALERHPERRFSGALEFANALRPFAGGPRVLEAAGAPIAPRPDSDDARFVTTVMKTAADAPPVSSAPPGEEVPSARRSNASLFAAALVLIGLLVAAVAVVRQGAGSSDPASELGQVVATSPVVPPASAAPSSPPVPAAVSSPTPSSPAPAALAASGGRSSGRASERVAPRSGAAPRERKPSAATPSSERSAAPLQDDLRSLIHERR
jgi:serine/threonine protein kinase